MHIFKASITVKEDIETVFKFFNRPENLVKLMPPFMKFKLLTPGELTMKEGAIFDYHVAVFGIPNRWTTYINDYKPPYYFTDIQLKGPHSYWHHLHRFEKVNNGTRVIDEIHYMLPLGPLGKIGNLVIMKPIVNALFKHRTKVIQEQFTIYEAS